MVIGPMIIDSEMDMADEIILAAINLRADDLTRCLSMSLFSAGIILLLTVSHAESGEAAQAKPAPAVVPREVTIPRTHQIEIRSRINHRLYRVFVAEPLGETPSTGYPVIYSVDGNAFFATLVETARMQQRLVGPVVVVGVGYPTDASFDAARRYYDFTPFTPPDRLKDQLIPGQQPVSETGGNEEFVRVLEHDVKPLVEREFKIDRDRQTLVGHSLGGLFVLHVLFTHPDAFQTYVASSPSLWWDNQVILKEEQSFLALAGVKGPNRGVRSSSPNDATVSSDGTIGKGRELRLLITVGGIEQTPLPSDTSERGERRKKNRMVGNARDMFDRLVPLSESGLRVVFKEFEGENHGSVVPCAISRAVSFSLDNAIAHDTSSTESEKESVGKGVKER